MDEWELNVTIYLWLIELCFSTSDTIVRVHRADQAHVLHKMSHVFIIRLSCSKFNFRSFDSSGATKIKC